MEKTTNYQLNKPEATDPMRVSDFNENADKIDAALNTLSTGMENAGNCKIASGSYAGTGTYGSGSPTKITFPFVPKMVIITCAGYGGARTIYVNGSKSLMTMPYDYNSMVTCSFSNEILSWYSTNSAEKQLNLSGQTYLWVAFA